MSRRDRSNSRAEALMDERDDLLVQISLEADAETPDANKLFDMQQRLNRLESEIVMLRGAMP